MVRKGKATIGDAVRPILAALGLAVKPNTHLLPKKLADLPNVELPSYEDALRQACLVLLLVDHDEFRSRPQLSDGVAVVDMRGAWHTAASAAASS